MNDHSYLVNQLQLNSEPRMRLNFNHPVKELIWLAENPKPKFERKYYNFIIQTEELLEEELTKEELKIKKREFEKFQMKFYEDLFTGKITIKNEINDKTIDNYIKKYTYDLLDFNGLIN